MNFRSVNDLNSAIITGLSHIPRDIDLIVGIPRSGLLPANLLATYLERPLTDVDGLLNRRLFSTGRTRAANLEFSWKAGLRVLVVDDSIDTGKSLDAVKARLAGLDYHLIYCIVYAVPGSESRVDITLETCPQPRVFQWNVMHHHIITQSCLDIDGVLCRDPFSEENDDGERYLRFLQDVQPLFVPSVKARFLVTNRLEKYRDITEQWLNKHGIRYEQLIMMNVATKEERLKAGRHSANKAEFYKDSDAKLFIESSLKQSVDIAARSGKPVLCVENWSIVTPDYRLPNLPYHINAFYRNHGYKLPYFTFWQKLGVSVKRKVSGIQARTK